MQTTAISPETDTSLPRPIRAQMQRVREIVESQQPIQAPNEEPSPSHEPSASPAAPSPDASMAPEAPKPSQEDPRYSDPAYWKQRFQVTYGMLDKERRERTHSESQLNQRISDLMEQLRLAQMHQPQPRSQTEDEVDLSQFFTPEQIEQYGEEQCKTLAQVSMRTGREAAQAAINEALKPIQEREKKSQEDREREAENAFYDALAEAVPDYLEIDADEAWRAWLAEIDPETGFQRQAILNNHVKKRNAAGTAALFNKFKLHSVRPEPVVAPQGSASRPEAPIPQAAPAGGGYPSQAEIKDFYKRSSLGKVKDDERARFEDRLKLPRPA